jgi:hypothetical protein
VSKDEGLHSSKAIAFIVNKCSRSYIRLEKKIYSVFRASLDSASELLRKIESLVYALYVSLIKDLGD